MLLLRDGKTTFTNQKGMVREATFVKNTSEYSILVFLAEHIGTPIETNTLISQLKSARENANYADEKQRVIDKIKAIRKKLGKEIISSTPNGYLLDCEVTRA